MEFYHIIQLNPTKYVILDSNFKRLNTLGDEPVDSALKDRVVLTLGQTLIFIKKNKGAYTTYLKFNCPQLNGALRKYDIVKKINAAEERPDR
jgi:hypothetical protein